MKYRLILLICLLPALICASDWTTITNTNHVTDLIATPQFVYTATWGGAVQYTPDINPQALPVFHQNKVFTTVDSLAANDLRTLAYEPTTGDVWMGTATAGISILKRDASGSYHMLTVNTEYGLPSNTIRRIVSSSPYVYVATAGGISQFSYLEGVFFPLPLHQYTNASTQGGLVNDDVQDMVITQNGYLYCATPTGMSFVHTDSLDIQTAWHRWTSGNSILPVSNVLSLSTRGDILLMNTPESLHSHSTNPWQNNWQSWYQQDGQLPAGLPLFSCYIDFSLSYWVTFGVWNENALILNRPRIAGQPDYQLCHIVGNTVTNIEANTYLPTLASIYRLVDYSEGTAACTNKDGFILFHNNEVIPFKDNCPGFQTMTEFSTDANDAIWAVSGNVGVAMTKKGTRGVSKWKNGIWTNYNVDNSLVTSDNEFNVETDSRNRKWFGSWSTGPTAPPSWFNAITVYDDTPQHEAWSRYSTLGWQNWNNENYSWDNSLSYVPHLLSNTIGEILLDHHNNVLVSCSSFGIVALTPGDSLYSTFQIPIGNNQMTTLIYDTGTRYYFGTYNDGGLVIWDSDTPPNPEFPANHWVFPPNPELHNCIVYGVTSFIDTFGVEEDWIAASTGLFMYNGTNWYKYDVDVKARIWKNGGWSSNMNDGATLYYVDEPRLFGSVRTSPTCIFLDNFRHLWIGSQDYGFSRYDIDSERYTNYNKDNSPLLSNFITTFGYDPVHGNLLVGTPEGLNTLRIGYRDLPVTHLTTAKAYPNPFNPNQGSVHIINSAGHTFPTGSSDCLIYDSSGALVIRLKLNEFGRYEWNGRNAGNKPCADGIYYFTLSDRDGTTARGKIALVRS